MQYNVNFCMLQYKLRYLAEVNAEVLLLLSISPRSLSGVDLDIPEHEADEVISSSLSCSSLDSSLELSCTKTPAAKPAIALIAPR